MKNSSIQFAVGTVSVAAITALSTIAIAQDSTSSDAAVRDRAEKAASERTQQEGIQQMEEVGKAYRDLHEVALGTLETESRHWVRHRDSRTDGDRDRQGPAREDGVSGARDTTNAADDLTASITRGLRGEELLIAACADGLLAGAPVRFDRDSESAGSPRSGDSGSAAGRDGAFDRTGNGADSSVDGGELVGMVLVCAHSTASAPDRGDRKDRAEVSDARASGSDDASAREAGSTRDGESPMGSTLMTKPLEPGVYAVNHLGNSVWLTDREGHIVLLSSMESRVATAGDTPRRTGEERSDQDSAGTSDRMAAADARVANTSAGGPEWEYVFGAITKDAMTSMGWAERAQRAAHAK